MLYCFHILGDVFAIRNICPLAAAEIPPSTAYGFAIAETDAPTLDAETRQRRENMRRIADIARQP